MSKKRPKPPKRRVRKKWVVPSCCLGCEEVEAYTEQETECEMECKGDLFIIKTNQYVCSECGNEIMSPAQADVAVEKVREAYRKKHEGDEDQE